MKSLIVAGGGVAGIYASILIKKACPGLSLTVLEANDKTLRKLLATGNGRCNLSNRQMNSLFYEGTDLTQVEEIVSKFDIVDALKQLGIQTKWLNDLLYPRSEQAKTVRDVLMAHVEKLGIKVLTQTAILSIAYHRHTYHITTDKQTFKSDGLILTMGTVAGGLSYGCDRAFILSPLYLNIRDYEPMLTKMVTKENLKSLKGTRVKGRITLKKDDHTLAVEDGELLFTNYGVSGIAVMNLSRDYVPGCTLHIDMMPDITLSELKEMIISSPLDEPLTGLLPGELTKYFIKHHFDYPIIKNMTLHIVELKGASDAQVMKGGITLNQLNDHLEFKNYPHLYAAGEILDVTGLCGGYNLHFAFASAARVAEGIIDELKEDVT